MLHFQIASMSHRMFVFELESMLESCSFTAHPAPEHCELGTWLAAHADELGHLSHFQELRANYYRFNAVAGEIAARMDDGDVIAARELGASTLKQASYAVLSLIAALESEMKDWEVTRRNRYNTIRSD